MASLIQPLSSQVPIVDEEGRPTTQFARLLQQIGLANSLELNNGIITIAPNGITNAMLADMANHTIKARNTAAAGDPEDVTLSAILDWLSGTQGAILYRDSNANGWKALGPGTSGQFLKTQGSAANPVWANAPLPARTIVQLSSNASITNNNFTVKSWASGDIVSDPLGAWSSGNASRFTTPSGMTQALITISATWASNNTGVRWAYARANANNANVLVQDVRPANNESACGIKSVWITGLTATSDYIDFTFAQTSGGNLNLTGGSGLATATRCMIEWAP
jgi:hypothetical protein